VYHYSATRTRSTSQCSNGYTRKSAPGAQAQSRGLAPQRAIKKLIESSFDYLALHPDFIVLLNDENRGGARHCARFQQARGHAFAAGQHVSKILKEGVRAGTFRKGVNPVHLYISIAGLSYFFFSNTPTLSAIFGRTCRAPPPGEPAANTWSTS